MRIVCPDGSDEVKEYLTVELQEKLKQLGLFSWFNGRPETSESYLERVGDADGILLGGDIPAEVLNYCQRLKIIAYLGTDPRRFIDLSLATRKGIVVANTPHYGDHTIAEHTWALILCCAKRVTQYNSLLRQGMWDQSGYNIQLWGKKLGLVGLGGIGGEVACLARAFGMQVLCWTPHPSPEKAKQHDVHFVSLKELFQQADVVTLHVRHTPETERMIGKELLDLLKPEAIFVNTARGELVDNEALAELLRIKKIGAAGLDVFDREPIECDNPFVGVENVVLTPHVAYNTREANCDILKISVENIAAFFAGHPQNVVNPDVLTTRRS
jgi:phosphoglycerate dehydrogenase-like enzyme